MRWFTNSATSTAPLIGTVSPRTFDSRDVLAGVGRNSQRYPFNPSQTTPENFYNLFAAMHSDDPFYDPRGTDHALGNVTATGRDTLSMPMDARCDPKFPALFKNPFRSFIGGYTSVTPAVPHPTPARYLESYVSSNPTTAGRVNAFLSIDATMLRRRDTLWSPWDLSQGIWPRTSAAINSTETQIDAAFDPLFTLNFPRQADVPYGTGPNQLSAYASYLAYSQSGSGTTQNPIIFRNREADYRNTDRNPFFRYQLYNRLSNVATTRSNVYAIWVTLGYFEVERVQPTQALPSQEVTGFNSGSDQPVQYRFPDGFRILREMGSESGDIVRHRAFAIFDRTIPVGFLRGENLNVDQAFLVRRILN
jgi:hypothetical protein